MHPLKIQKAGKDKPTVEGHPPEEENGPDVTAAPGDAMAGPRPAESEGKPACAEPRCPLPPGQHPYDPVKKDLDPVGFALDRVQTFLVWIDEHRATFEKARDTDKEVAEAELSNLRDSTRQGMIYLQRLSELLLAGYAIDPGKRLPESLRRGWFASCVDGMRGLAPDAGARAGRGGSARPGGEQPEDGDIAPR
jgi:hypothetical protein